MLKGPGYLRQGFIPENNLEPLTPEPVSPTGGPPKKYKSLSFVHHPFQTCVQTYKGFWCNPGCHAPQKHLWLIKGCFPGLKFVLKIDTIPKPESVRQANGQVQIKDLSIHEFWLSLLQENDEYEKPDFKNHH
jgi:hypothetical protein